MEGAIRLAFPREPDYFAAAPHLGCRSATFVIRDETGDIVATGSRTTQEVWLEGEPALLGYLSGLRVAPERRIGRRTLAEGYALARGTRTEDELPFDLTAIVADNVRARRLLERGLPGLPVYTPVGELVTLTFPVGRRTRRGFPPRGGSGLEVVDGVGGGPERIAARMADRLAREAASAWLAPRWGVDGLARLAAGGSGSWSPLVAFRDGAVAGCGAVWDQRPFRQCVVAGYAPALARIRRALNLFLRLAGRPSLPPPGSRLRLGYLSHLAADDEEVLAAIVEAALGRAAAVGLDHLSLALAAGDPRLEGLKGRFRGRELRSVLYLVAGPRQDGLAYVPRGSDIRVEVAIL